MNTEQQLELQAFLDGELPETEARRVAAWVARDREAADLVKELRNTRQALAIVNVPPLRVPESEKFYWSKIERGIRRAQPESETTAAVPFIARLWRRLLPIAAFATIAIVAAFVGLQSGVLRLPRNPDSQMFVADSGAFTYQDYASGTTLVWLDYPAER